MTGERRRVLVIDDNEDARLMYAEYFEIEGFTVLMAKNGHEGIAMAQTHRPDVIVLDVALPGLDGYQVLQRIRADDRTCRIPVLMLSASAGPEYLEKAAINGAQVALTKPVLPLEVLAIIRDLVGEAPVHDELQGFEAK